MTLLAPRRELGRTGFVATRLGVGDLADASLAFEACVAALRHALDRGLNLVDTAPSYEDGLSERIVGAALAGRRPHVFLIDKVDLLDEPVRPQIEASLDRLALPAADAFVFHGVSDLARFQALTAPGGRFAELEACRAAGLCRFVGVSTHHPEVARAAILSGRSDLLMFPVGPFVHARYTDEILPLSRERGVGSVCFKTFGAGKLLGDTSGYGRPLDAAVTVAASAPRLGVEDCVHYTLTHDPDVALLGMSTPHEIDAALAATESFAPLSAEALASVRRRAAQAVRGKGPCWWDPAP